ncbi:hypothetical protein BCIN_07g00600 [Botrytis cinerea B05.10]|uniref:Uncharacterized protein n=3 Tax=Botryotinia fuckeliana TaxID=40559 RepID=A0A384JLP0_BOTFB|nr:hypothetical protein BCIN_07g00600 [Botrytis cinerea B05.10]ATZ51420.1 hypothetical protein BCIN_07g00600 [Botrytis cinerea B05.10]EMR83446.1 hypothetical protein BcDW1_7880 [Botrytis cinerea BcDW1]CCD42713.1 hypothetical protein BofuT4_P073250.1 [Botrytis cinerea T4]
MNRTSMSLLRGSKYLARSGASISQRRFASSETPSPTRAFYKTFTRPIAKTLLIATFIYQLTYWGWVKLEKDELKAGKRREIKELEEELEKISGGAIKGEDVKVKGI